MANKWDKMKKTLLLLIILAGVSANSFAGSIGLSFGVKQKDKLVLGPSLLFSGNYTGALFAVDFFFDDYASYIGGTIDYFLFAFELIEPKKAVNGSTNYYGSSVYGSFSLRLGIGMYLDFTIPNSGVEKPIEKALGFRAPIQGIWHLSDKVSIFLTVAPTATVAPTLKGEFIEFIESAVKSILYKDKGNFKVAPASLGVLFWL
jgi:hypothetical protein